MREIEPKAPVVRGSFHTSVMDSGITVLQESTASSTSTSPIEIKSTSSTRSTPTASPSIVKPTKTVFPDGGDDQPDKTARKSTGSFTMQQQEALDQRRRTFSSVTADGRALMRRRSCDFTDFASLSAPQALSSQNHFHHKSSHSNHMRVYGKTSDDGKQISACHEEGQAFVDVMKPSKHTVWTRGNPVSIEWKVLDSKVEYICIELMEEGSSATTTIAKTAANNGFYSYGKVPWGMACGDKYFLCISSCEDSSRFMTTNFFQIGTAP